MSNLNNEEHLEGGSNMTSTPVESKWSEYVTMMNLYLDETHPKVRELRCARMKHAIDNWMTAVERARPMLSTKTSEIERDAYRAFKSRQNASK
jgi:hypothetical protein